MTNISDSHQDRKDEVESLAEKIKSLTSEQLAILAEDIDALLKNKLPSAYFSLVNRVLIAVWCTIFATCDELSEDDRWIIGEISAMYLAVRSTFDPDITDMGQAVVIDLLRDPITFGDLLSAIVKEKLKQHQDRKKLDKFSLIKKEDKVNE